MKRLKWRGLCLLLILGLLCSMPLAYAAEEIEFSDVPTSHWAFGYIRTCARAGFVFGVGGGRFAPDDHLTTEQFITLVGRVSYELEAQKDIKPGDKWSGAYIRAGRRLGLLEGMELSDLSAPILRCDMAVLLCNVLVKLRGQSYPTMDYREKQPAGYDMSRYAQAIGVCYSAGLFKGYDDGLFHGGDCVTRAQGAKIITLLAGLDPQPLSGNNAPRTDNTRVPILMYHSVVPDGQSCGPWTTNTSQFRRDLQWLTDHGYSTVLPRELLQGNGLPEKPVMITFDDGYGDNYTCAYPLLREYGAKAVISPVVSYVEENRDNFLTWDMCRIMSSSGFIEFGSHTYDCHRSGIGRNSGESYGDYSARVLSDIQRSVDLLHSRLGTDVHFFAYPHGTLDPWADDYLRSHFWITVTSQHGTADLSKGRYDLPRFNMSLTEPVTKYLSS